MADLFESNPSSAPESDPPARRAANGVWLLVVVVLFGATLALLRTLG